MTEKQRKRMEELAKSKEVIRDTYCDSAFTAENAFIKGYTAALADIAPLVEACRKILNKINMVTAFERHGLRVDPEDMTNLCNAQVDFEAALAEIGET